MLSYPAKILLKVFPIFYKILSAYCVGSLKELADESTRPVSKQIPCLINTMCAKSWFGAFLFCVIFNSLLVFNFFVIFSTNYSGLAYFSSAGIHNTIHSARNRQSSPNQTVVMEKSKIFNISVNLVSDKKISKLSNDTSFDKVQSTEKIDQEENDVIVSDNLVQSNNITNEVTLDIQNKTRSIEQKGTDMMINVMMKTW